MYASMHEYIHTFIYIRNKQINTSNLTQHTTHYSEQIIYNPDWKTDFIAALEKASSKNGIDYHMFSWLLPIDIDVLNVMALPIGENSCFLD